MAQNLNDLNFNIGVNVTGLPQIQQVQARMTSLNNTIKRSTSQYNENAVATNKWAKGALQQAGYQVGDYYVQIANGTSAMQAFGQQGSQMLGIFGPVGAVLGAAVAIFSSFGVAAQRASSAVNKFSLSFKDIQSVSLGGVRSALSDLEGIQNRYNSALENSADASNTATRIILANSEKEFNARMEVLKVERQLLVLRTQAVIKQLQDLQREQESLRLQAIETARALGPGSTGIGSEYARAAFDVEALHQALGSELLNTLRTNAMSIKELEAELVRLGIASEEAADLATKAFGEVVDGAGDGEEEVRKLGSEIRNATNDAIKLRDAMREVGQSSVSQDERIQILRAQIAAAQRGVSVDVAGEQARVAIELGKAGASIDQIAAAAQNAGEKAGVIEQLNNQLRDLTKTSSDAGSSARKVAEDIKLFGDGFDELDAIVKQVGGTIENSMTDALMSTIDKTKDTAEAFKSMARAIIAELYKVLVVQQMVGSVEKGTGIAGFIGKALGFRADGGQVTSGRPYIVGEQGPELIVPSRNAHVVPNNQLGGSGSVVVQQYNTFGNGVSRAEVQSMLPKMVEATKAAVLDAKRRGGAYGGAF